MTAAMRPGQYAERELEAEHIRPEGMRHRTCPTCGHKLNPHEERNREEKVRRLVEKIDEELGGFNSGYAAEAIADQLEAWPAEAWVQLAWKARVLSPSSVSVAQVIETYRVRSKS